MVGNISALICDGSAKAPTGIYAFQPDTTTSRLSHQPLIKATTRLMALINSLCAMLRTSPFHKDNYSRLILTVVVEFYQRCYTRFQELILTGEQKTADADPKIALAADWAQRPDLHPCLSEIFKISEINTPKKDQLHRQETHLELNFVGEDGIVEKNNLIGSTRNLATLGSLYTSLVGGCQISHCIQLTEPYLSSSGGSPTRWMFSKPSPSFRCHRQLHSGWCRCLQ